jgi:hypothetical protein
LAWRPIRAARDFFARRPPNPASSPSTRHPKPQPPKAFTNHALSLTAATPVEPHTPIKPNFLTRNSTPLSTRQPAAASIPAHYTDLSPGARHFGIRPRAVFIESDILDSYTEKEVCLGRNVAGIILAALACHAAGVPDDVPDGSILVRLVRRDDGCLVRLVLHVRRLRRRGLDCVLLSKTGDREIDWDFN